jgi:myo-inositol-1(or 4)-monophosphatase
LNLAYVACGRIDAFWSSSLKPWDMAAGAAIVAESGGTVTAVDGTVFDISTPEILASNGTGLHAQVVELLEEIG